MVHLKGLILTFFVISVIINVASSQQQRQQHQQRHHERRVQSNLHQRRNQVQDSARPRRIYAMCPPNFSKIGNECYYISPGKASWLDAHFDCKDKNSKLAEPLKYADRRLRKYLTGQQRHSGGNIWIGGMYNWQRMKWQWGYNGKDMTYQSFSQMKPGSSNDLKFHCSVMNPDLQYRWSAKLCMEKNNFICQHKMPYVGERNRERIWAKWNETFPNQLANEIEVYITTNGNSNKNELYKLATKRPRVSSPKGKDSNRLSTQLEQQHSRSNSNNRINNDINPPEVLTHHDSVDPRQSKPRNKKQGGKKLTLSGNVDLGTDQLKENRRKKMPRKNKSTTRMTTTSTTTERSNDLPIYPHLNHHRHHHNEHHQENRQEYIAPETPRPRETTSTTTSTTTTRPRETTTSTTTERSTSTSTTTTLRPTTSTTTSTTTPRPTTTTPEPYEPEPETTTYRPRPRPPTTTPQPYYEPTTQTTTTTAPADDEQETTTLSVRALKAARIQKLRERLANLSPEDQKEYIRMKLQRSQEKKQQNETNP